MVSVFKVVQVCSMASYAPEVQTLLCLAFVMTYCNRPLFGFTYIVAGILQNVVPWPVSNHGAEVWFNLAMIMCCCLCRLHQSYMTITAGVADCPILGEFGFSQEGAGIFNMPVDGAPNTQDLHSEHDPPTARQQDQLAPINQFGWYGMWRKLLEVVELVYLSSSARFSVAWTAVHSRGSPTCWLFDHNCWHNVPWILAWPWPELTKSKLWLISWSIIQPKLWAE